MSEAECQSAAPLPGRRRYQFRLRTLLVLTAVVALALPLFLPIMTPSPLLDWPGSGLPSSLQDPVGKLVESVVPPGMLRGGGGSRGADATSWRGRWHYDKHATIQCTHAATGQIMRDLQTALRQYIQKSGAQVLFQSDVVKMESQLTSFHFAYAYGSHRGTIDVQLQLGAPHGNAASSKELPLNEVHWEIEELAGTAKTE